MSFMVGNELFEVRVSSLEHAMSALTTPSHVRVPLAYLTSL